MIGFAKREPAKFTYIDSTRRTGPPVPPPKVRRTVMSDDRAFYERRVREELAQAAKESDPRLRQLHEGWADCYRERPNRLRTRADGLRVRTH